MDARPVSAAAERRRRREGVLNQPRRSHPQGTFGAAAGAGHAADATEPPWLGGPLADLIDELARDVRVLGWSEGIHLRTEYLAARNAVVRHLAERHALRAIAVESNFALSRPADAYIRGLGPPEPATALVRGVWSWSRAALEDNRTLLTWLRRHNAGLAPGDQVRLYGLEMYGTSPQDPEEAPDSDAFGDLADQRHADRLRRRLGEHRVAGGDHRDLAVRDAAQYLTLQEVARRHPDGPILLFEQVEHLDRRIPGSLGEHLAREDLGPFRAVGAVWRDGDPTVRYPLGRYRELSHHLEDAAAGGKPGKPGEPAALAGPAGTAVVDLRPWQPAVRPGPATGQATPAEADAARITAPLGPDAQLADAATAFEAVLYAPVLSPARTTAGNPPDHAVDGR